MRGGGWVKAQLRRVRMLHAALVVALPGWTGMGSGGLPFTALLPTSADAAASAASALSVR
jgi:hypothetical protein